MLGGHDNDRKPIGVLVETKRVQLLYGRVEGYDRAFF